MKFISEKASSKARPAKVIAYIMNPEKCCTDENGEILLSTIGLDDERPYSQQFKEIAELAGNDYTLDDRKYYHFKLTVSPEDYDPNGTQNITPEQLKQIAEDLVHEKFPGYQAVITIQYHDNGKQGEEQNDPHLHAHIVVNASSFDPEKNKLRLENKDLDELRDYAYEAGLKYNLHERYWRDEVAEKRAHQRQNQSEPEAINISEGEKAIIDKHGKNFSDHSWKEQYRIAIDEAKGATTNLDSFRNYLKDHFHIDTQITKQGTIKYKMPERTTYSSGKKLGADYTLEAVEKSLAETKNKPSDLPKAPTGKEAEALEWHRKFEEEYAKFKKWQEEEYQKQREEFTRREKEGDTSAEYYRNKTVLENTNALYRLCEQAKENEILAATLTEKEQAEMRELEQRRAELEKQQQQAQLAAVHRVSYNEQSPERMRVQEQREQKRQQYIDTLQTTGTSLADRIKAAQGIRDMNIEEGKKSRENELYQTYGKDTRKHVIYAKRDWQLQRQIDSVRVARELGANNQAEMELKVKQEGREYGKIKREYTAAKKQYDEAVNAATAEITNDSSLSVEDRIKKLEETKAAEYEKLRPIEEKFQAAKQHYKECAQALDTIKANNARNTIYETGEPEQTEKKQAAPGRSKEEAEKARLKQWSEIRDWSDEATKTVAQKPGAGKEADLKEWAAEMEKHGCQIRITANTISIKHPDSSQAVRSNRLGGAYEKEEIVNGIQVQRQTNRTTDRATNRTADRAGAGQQQTNGNSRAAQGNSRSKVPGRELVRERIRERGFER